MRYPTWLVPGLLLLTTACSSTGPLFSSSSSSSGRNTASTVARRPSTRPTTTAKTTKTAAPLRTVDSRTYNSRYVSEVIGQARTYTGTPYRSGGNGYDGIDCSGLVCAAFSSVGLKMPRISWQQSEVGYEIEVSDIRPGDLVFFVPESGKEGYVSHVAIVTEVKAANDIRFIHASSSRGVREDNLYSNYFKGRFVKALRPF